MAGGRKVIFEFVDDEAAKGFLEWWSGGLSRSGEFLFLQAERARIGNDKPIPKLDYSRAFGTWGHDPQIHGPDYTIQVQPQAAGKAATP